MFLLLDVLADDAQRGAVAGYDEVGRRPEVPVHDVPVHAAGELRPQPLGGDALEQGDQPGHHYLQRVLNEQVHVVVVEMELARPGAEGATDLPYGLLTALEHVRVGHAMPVLRHDDQMAVARGDHMPARRWPAPNVIGRWHALCVQVRYRYRLYPTPGQQRALARVFGCARVVYNDCLRVRDECHARGEKISDTEVQRRVITLAKATPQRAWLGEVASVALVQACQDARRAYRNWFDSLQGRRKGPKIGHPKLRRKRGRQSIRLTRNGFALHGDRLYVAKVGDIRVAWSRGLPSVPSSVTVIRDSDDRYYASFVVQRPATPLPACDREIGIDLGLASLVVTSGGEAVANPRFYRSAQRRLRRAQRVLSRRQEGSANRVKARRRVAVVHRKVREARLDHAHKVALRLVRDNQAVYAEDLCTSGLARTRLAKSVTDAGWSLLLRCIEEKAARYGRTFAKVGRFEPTSQVCSACGVKDGPKPLAVRTWTCAACGAVHDRDVNAARNILAAGRAERLNACGTGIRPLLGVAAGAEAGTHRSVA
jgi:putative transposase